MTGLRIKELCKEKGITLNELAAKVGISQPSISLISNGKQKPTFDTLERIAAALDVCMSELFSPVKNIKIQCPHCGKIITLAVVENEP
ncbi:MAG: helix-turn-helix transcriptional regulator [Bacteroidales bacterium]|nr:helix-turn-helix transcriptional regulator [Bacteroidales bacterium]